MSTNYKSKYQEVIPYRVNRQITSQSLRVIDEKGSQIGVMSREEAFGLAQEKELDIIEVAPGAIPPVAKIIDYNKFLYQLKKRKQDEKKKAIVSLTKEIRLRPFIGDHDLEIKLKKAKEFLEDRNKVRFVVQMTQRLMGKKELAHNLLERILTNLKEVAKVDKQATWEGRRMIMIVSKIK